jgi:hypothetical protein
LQTHTWSTVEDWECYSFLLPPTPHETKTILRNQLIYDFFCSISSIVAMRMRNIFVAPNAIFNLLPYKTKQDKALKILHGHTNEVIAARREQLKNSDFEFDGMK